MEDSFTESDREWVKKINAAEEKLHHAEFSLDELLFIFEMYHRHKH